MDDQTIRTTEEQKRARVLDGAVKVFMAYGFARTTMDDIARASEISRPALYLLFRNKTDIYRAIASTFLEHCIGQARVALSEGLFAARLETAIDSALIGLTEQFSNAPHGAEILDMKNSLAGDIIASGRQRMVELLSGTIEKEAARTGANLKAKGLSAEGLANLLLDGLEGMKMRAADTETQRTGARELIRVVDLVLRP